MFPVGRTPSHRRPPTPTPTPPTPAAPAPATECPAPALTVADTAGHVCLCVWICVLCVCMCVSRASGLTNHGCYGKVRCVYCVCTALTVGNTGSQRRQETSMKMLPITNCPIYLPSTFFFQMFCVSLLDDIRAFSLKIKDYNLLIVKFFVSLPKNPQCQFS